MDGVGKLVGNVGFMAQYILYLRISHVLPKSTFCAGIIMPNAFVRGNGFDSFLSVYRRNLREEWI